MSSFQENFRKYTENICEQWDITNTNKYINNIDSQNLSTHMKSFSVDVALKLSCYTSLKLLICIKWILKMFPHYHILSWSNIDCQSLPLSLSYLYNLKHIKTFLNYISWKDIRIKQLHFICLNTSKVQEIFHT